MTTRKLPSNASVANPGDGDRLVAPAASRNTAALCELLERHAPATGRALELASGTGQHVAAFAQRLPGLRWQPSEIDPQRRASIDAYAQGIPNVDPAIELNAVGAGWHKVFVGQDVIVLVNLLHLISWTEVQILIREAALALIPDGRLIIYGPFMRDGCLTSDGDKRFHNALIQQDAEIGYKNDQDMIDLFLGFGLKEVETIEMPANNLAFVAKRPSP